MRRIALVFALLLSAVVLAAALPDGGVNRTAFARFADFGSAEDFSAEQDIYFPKPPSNYWLWGMRDAKKFIRYENEDRFYWVTKPANPEQFTTARVLKSWYSAKVRIRALDEPATQGMLAIRFKDNLPEPTTVEVTTNKGWAKLGTLGGAFDHKWKVATFPFNTQKAMNDGQGYEVRIGRGDYGDLRADLPIDWVGLATQSVAVPGPAPGFWPDKTPSRFSRLRQTQEYVPGEGPRFLAGVLVKGMREGSWKQYHKDHINAVIFQGWETIWKRHWARYASGNYQDRIRYGFPDFVEACAENQLLCTSQFFTDTRSYWIDRQYGSEEAVLDTLYEVMKFNRKAKGNLGWYIKDEADHNDESWGSPPEFLLQMHNLAKKADPDRPVIALFQGWKPGAFKMFDDSFDVAAFDVYPVGAGRRVTEIADRIERMRDEVGPGKALWAVIEAHEGEHVKKLGRQLTAAETLVQGYLCLTHDIQGVFYYIGNEATYIDFDNMPGPAAGMRQFFAEVNGPGGMADFFLPGSQTIARTGVRSTGNLTTVSTDAVHFIYKRKADGKNLLVAINTRNVPKDKVKIVISGLMPGREVKVRFEDRSLTSNDRKAIVDSFEPYGRHVYEW
ncbi:MAG: hypothetical protein P9L99_17325 [Candidatus Lernaella stagnicola]|nr:hypothetical protein [Candidatus Lernaella stagnicola]